MSMVVENFTKEELVEQIINEFDFKKVHKAMRATDWKWADEEDSERLSFPGVDRLKSRAKKLLIDTINHSKKNNDRYSCYRTGGFTATFDPEDGVISLEFKLETGYKYIPTKCKIDRCENLISTEDGNICDGCEWFVESQGNG